MGIQKQHEDFDLWWEGNAIAMMCEEDEALKIWQAAKAQSVPETKQFNLDEFLTMEEKLKHKGGVITADLDRFVAYAEMVLGKAKAQSVPEGQILVNKGDYVELVRTNRERQKTVARLTEEVKILRDRKKYYKNKCKGLEFGDD